MKSGISLLVTSTLSTVPTVVRAHGYMKTPRSRNFVAYQDKHYDWEPSEELPMPEDCESNPAMEMQVEGLVTEPDGNSM